MSNKTKCDINDLLELFSESLSASEVLSSKLMSQISATITKERLKMQMSQKDFAVFLGVTQSEISRWEHGDYNFSIKKVSEIAAKLDMDIDIVFTKMDVKKYLDSNNLSYHPSVKTFIYSSGKTNRYSEKQSYKTGMEDFKHASICK